MDEELISEQLSMLTDKEAMNLIKAIRAYLTDETDVVLEENVINLFAYFKELPFKYKSIFLFLFQCEYKNPNNIDRIFIQSSLEEVNFIFQKKHIMSIFAEVNGMPEDIQKMWYDNIYVDLAPRYDYFLEKNGKTRK